MHVSCRINSILTDVLDNTVTGGHFVAEKWHERGGKEERKKTKNGERDGRKAFAFIEIMKSWRL